MRCSVCGFACGVYRACMRACARLVCEYGVHDTLCPCARCVYTVAPGNNCVRLCGVGCRHVGTRSHHLPSGRTTLHRQCWMLHNFNPSPNLLPTLSRGRLLRCYYSSLLPEHVLRKWHEVLHGRVLVRDAWPNSYVQQFVLCLVTIIVLCRLSNWRS